MSNVSSLHEPDDAYMQQQQNIYENLVRQYTVIIVFMCVLGVTGIIGNIVTIVFYVGEKPRAITTLVKALSVTDLLVSVLAFVTVAETLLNIKLKSRFVCKAMYFLYYWFIYCSIILVSLIANERYRRMCRPFGGQFTRKSARMLIAVAWLLMGAVASRSFLTVDIVQTSVVIGRTSAPLVSPANTSESRHNVKPLTTTLNDVVRRLDDHTTSSITSGALMYDFRASTHTLRSSDFAKATAVNSITTDIVDDTNTTPETMAPSLSVMVTQSITKQKDLNQASQISLGVADEDIDVSTETSDTETTDITTDVNEPIVDDIQILLDLEETTNVIVDRITVNFCTFVTDPRLKPYVVAFHIADTVCVSLVILNFIVSYASVVWTLIKHRRRTKYLHVSETRTTSTETAVVPVANTESGNTFRLGNNVGGCSQTTGAGNNVAPGNTNKTNIIKQSEIQITVAMLVVSVGLLVSFAPYFTSVTNSNYKSGPWVEENILDASRIFMLRCAFINSVINPLIYYIFSTKYRKYVNKLVHCTCRIVRDDPT